MTSADVVDVTVDAVVALEMGGVVTEIAAAAAADGTGSRRRQRGGRGVTAVAVMMRVVMKRASVVADVSTVKWHIVDAVTVVVVAVVGVEMMRWK